MPQTVRSTQWSVGAKQILTQCNSTSRVFSIKLTTIWIWKLLVGALLAVRSEAVKSFLAGQTLLFALVGSWNLVVLHGSNSGREWAEFNWVMFPSFLSERVPVIFLIAPLFIPACLRFPCSRAKGMEHAVFQSQTLPSPGSCMNNPLAAAPSPHLKSHPRAWWELSALVQLIASSPEMP